MPGVSGADGPRYVRRPIADSFQRLHSVLPPLLINHMRLLFRPMVHGIATLALLIVEGGDGVNIPDGFLLALEVV